MIARTGMIVRIDYKITGLLFSVTACIACICEILIITSTVIGKRCDKIRSSNCKVIV